jgi:hypothetical protein
MQYLPTTLIASISNFINIMRKKAEKEGASLFPLGKYIVLYNSMSDYAKRE